MEQSGLFPFLVKLTGFSSKGAMHKVAIFWFNITYAWLWNVQSPECRTASSNWEILATLVQPCVQNTPGKTCMSCWLNPWESDPEVIQGPGGVTTSLTLFGPILVWSKNCLKLLLTVRCFKSSWGCCLCNFPGGKMGMKMNKWMFQNMLAISTIWMWTCLH